jgi:hypothetical protein
MNRTIPESDWKLFRELHPIALNRFCDQILTDIADVAGDTKATPHKRYLRIHQIVQQRDQKMAEVFDDPRRSTAIMKLRLICSHGFITEVETERFTQETRDAITRFAEQRA